MGNTTATMEPISVGVNQIPGLTGISRRSFYRLLSSGMAPRGHKAGARRLWLVAELRRWAELGFCSAAELAADQQGDKAA